VVSYLTSHWCSLMYIGWVGLHAQGNLDTPYPWWINMKSCSSSTLRSSLVVVVLALLSFLVVCIISKLLFIFTASAGKEVSKSEVDECELKILKECVWLKENCIKGISSFFDIVNSLQVFHLPCMKCLQTKVDASMPMPLVLDLDFLLFYHLCAL
jgi:ABC-type transport system involved in multi-copper enzyme maturation permease subunit